MGAEGRAGATVPAGVLEGIRAGYRAFNRGEMAAAVAWLNPDLEWWPAGGIPGWRVIRGRAEA